MKLRVDFVARAWRGRFMDDDTARLVIELSNRRLIHRWCALKH